MLKLFLLLFARIKIVSQVSYIKFTYSEKATKFCEISTVDLFYVVMVKSQWRFRLLRIYELYTLDTKGTFSLLCGNFVIINRLAVVHKYFAWPSSLVHINFYQRNVCSIKSELTLLKGCVIAANEGQLSQPGYFLK
jgi:hypothetical protein